MICLAAAIGVLGIAAMRRAHRCGHGFHGYGWYGPYGDGMRRHGARRRWMMHALFRRIDATPAQERAIVAELEKLEDRVHAAKAGVHEARGDLAAALRGVHGLLDDRQRGQIADLLERRGWWRRGPTQGPAPVEV